MAEAEEYLVESDDEKISKSISGDEDSDNFDFEVDEDEDELSDEPMTGGAASGSDEVSALIEKTNKLYLESKEDDELDSEEEDDEDEDEHYLKKFDKDVRSNYIVNFHPESVIVNFQEVQQLCKIIRNDKGIICDDFHKTIPFLTKYEKTRVLGQRAKQINDGAKPYVVVAEHEIDGYLIAQMELGQKRLPFIIKRPLPNGGSEFWKLYDLQLI